MSRIVAWTGHRPDIFADPAAAQAAVDQAAQDLVINHGAEHFLVGGQRGVDTWAAQAALARGVPFTLILPLRLAEFTQQWSPADRATLESVGKLADAVRVIGGEPVAAYLERNRQLATQADLLVAVWTRLEGGGTAETIALAQATHTPVREVVLPIARLAHFAQGRGI